MIQPQAPQSQSSPLNGYGHPPDWSPRWKSTARCPRCGCSKSLPAFEEWVECGECKEPDGSRLSRCRVCLDAGQRPTVYAIRCASCSQMLDLAPITPGVEREPCPFIARAFEQAVKAGDLTLFSPEVHPQPEDEREPPPLHVYEEPGTALRLVDTAAPYKSSRNEAKPPTGESSDSEQIPVLDQLLDEPSSNGHEARAE